MARKRRAPTDDEVADMSVAEYRAYRKTPGFAEDMAAWDKRQDALDKRVTKELKIGLISAVGVVAVIAGVRRLTAKKKE